VKTPVLGITVGPGFTKLPDLQLYELRGVFAVVHTTGTQIFVECMAPVLLDSEPQPAWRSYSVADDLSDLPSREDHARAAPKLHSGPNDPRSSSSGVLPG
jgi:hypothetical protein